MNGVPTTIETIYEIGNTMLNSGGKGVEQAPPAVTEPLLVERTIEGGNLEPAIGEEVVGPPPVEREATLWERIKGFFWLPNWYYWSRGEKKAKVPTSPKEPKAKASKEAVQEERVEANLDNILEEAIQDLKKHEELKANEKDAFKKKQAKLEIEKP